MDSPDISVVIAAHNRPDTLGVAVMSALSQTMAAGEVIVVGDCCDPRVGQALARFGDAVRYLNLPFRCGEQSIPNAVGSAMARGAVIAYLNHDDIWLPGHLETSLATLEESGAGWHLGAAAFALRKGSDPDGVPRFTDRTPPNRTIRSAFSRTHRYVEPVSSWLVRAEAIASVGGWRPARRLYRTPTQDLALRLWRRTGEPSSCDDITVLKPSGAGTRLQGGGSDSAVPSYHLESAWHATLGAAYAVDGGVSFTAGFVLQEGPALDRIGHLSGDPNGAGRWAGAVARKVVGDRAASLYRISGVDLLSLACRSAGVPRGEMLARMLRKRTGEPGLPKVDPGEALAFAEASGV